MEKKRLQLDFNSPVILGFTLISFIVLIINAITGGFLNSFLAIRYTSWLDPFMYIRLFTHIFAHADLGHFTGNFMLVLVIGPLIEEKYGSSTLPFMIAVTSVVTGLINIIFFTNRSLIGASGVVFMLILLASFANLKEGKIPLTVILVAVLYIGNEILNGLFIQSNISRISHIAGGLCGGFFGYALNKNKLVGNKTGY